jgi:hypothetical protein
MPGKRRNAVSGHNRACVEGQHTPLMTQSRPGGSEQKDFNVLLQCTRRWPNANLLASCDFKVRNIFYPDKRTFCRVLKYKPADTFRYGRMASRDLNRDIENSCIIHGCRHASERDFGMRAPAAQHVRVGGSGAEVWLRRQGISRPCNTAEGEELITPKSRMG